VVAHPVGQIFPLPNAFQPLAVVVTEVGIDDFQTVHAFGHQPDFEASHGSVFDGDVFAVFHPDAQAVKFIGRFFVIGTDQHRAVKIDYDIVALNRQHRAIEAVLSVEVKGVGAYFYRFIDDQAVLQVNRLLGQLAGESEE